MTGETLSIDESREPRRRGRRNGLICHTSMSNDDGMPTCGFIGIFMTRKVLGSLSEVSSDSIKSMKMITKQENNHNNDNFWKDCEKRISP